MTKVDTDLRQYTYSRRLLCILSSSCFLMVWPIRSVISAALAYMVEQITSHMHAYMVTLVQLGSSIILLLTTK